MIVTLSEGTIIQKELTSSKSSICLNYFFYAYHLLGLCSLLQTQNFSQDVLSLTGKPDEVSVQLEGSVLSAPVEEVVVVAQLLSCQTLCDPMDYNKPGFPVFYYIP